MPLILNRFAGISLVSKMDDDGKPDIVAHVPIEYTDHERDGLREHGDMGFFQGERAIHSSASLNVQVHKEQQIIITMVIKDGSHLVLSSGKKHRWLIKVKRGSQFHTHHGIIEHDALIGMEFGDIYHAPRSRKGFVLIQPTVHELATRVSRKTQVIYPKDVGHIIIQAGIRPGCKILEAGTGSGAMSIMLGATVGFQGKIITYEVESSHYHAAVKNMQELGFQDIIEARMGNILDPATQSTIREDGPFDAIILDMPVPDQAVDLAWDTLKPCGKLCSFMPVIEQVNRLVNKLKQGKWFDIEVVDVAVRKWQVRENATRPRNLGHHTGFILFATKINESPPFDWTRKNRKMLIRKLEAQGKIGKLETGDMDFLDG